MEFKPTSQLILENDAVCLLPLSMEHVKNLLSICLAEANLWEHSLIQAYNEPGLVNYIKKALADREEGKAYPFAVYDKLQGKFAGSTRFYDLNLKQKCLTIGYTWYGAQFRGTKLNKNCKYLLLQFAFEQLNMERVEFRADSANTHSIAAMKSIGCVQEGVLRNTAYRGDGTRRDSTVLSMLRSEWEQGLSTRLKARLV